MKGGGTGEADDDAPLFAARRPTRRGRGALDLVQDRAGAIQKSGACIGKFYATRLATKQLYIEFLFERADLEAQRRLLNAKPVGGAGDVFFFRDGDEVAQVTQFHLPYLSNMDF